MESELILLEPSLELKEKALEYRAEHFANSEYEIPGSALFDKTENYEDWLKDVIASSNPDTVSPDWVLSDTWFVVRKEDGKIVGMANFRHELNDFLKDFGHIGYAIRPSERRKGYGSEMLGLVLEQARKAGLGQLQFSASQDNEASIRLIEKYGGKKVRTFNHDGKDAWVFLMDLQDQPA